MYCTVGILLEPPAALQGKKKETKLSGKCFLSVLLITFQGRMITSRDSEHSSGAHTHYRDL